MLVCLWTELKAYFLGLFFLFFFRFRNETVGGIIFPKKSHIVKTDYWWKSTRIAWTEHLNLTSGVRGCGATLRVWRAAHDFLPKFYQKTRILRIPGKPCFVHSIHSAIGSEINGISFCSFRKWNRSHENTITAYPEHSYSVIIRF